MIKTIFADGSSLTESGKIIKLLNDREVFEYPNGDKEYFLNDMLHREDGPAIDDVNGDKKWYINGKLHRTDGPAIEYLGGDKWWFINDKIHREDGPAIDNADGTKEWWINDKQILCTTQEEFERLMRLKVFW
jgi:hypothetical protein